MLDIVVVGGANTDYLISAARLPERGETVQGDLFDCAGGGKGANQAVAAARLGARVAFVGMVGNDERGEELLQTLLDEGIDVSGVGRSDSPTGAALIMVEQGGQKYIAAALGANVDLSPTHVDKSRRLLERTRIALAQLEVPVAGVHHAFALARQAGARCILDPGPAQPLPDALLSLVDVIRPNSIEAGIVSGVEVADEGSACSAAERLLLRGVGAAIIEAGEAGNLLVTPEHKALFRRLPVSSVDATGAGDAYAATLAVAMCEGLSLLSAAEIANAAAAMATTRLGARSGLARREELLEFLAAHGLGDLASELAPGRVGLLAGAH